MSTKLCLALVALAAFLSAVNSGSAATSALAACTAGAEDCMSDAEFRALTIRSLALNRKYGLGD
jgi:hypothetical protein